MITWDIRELVIIQLIRDQGHETRTLGVGVVACLRCSSIFAVRSRATAESGESWSIHPCKDNDAWPELQDEDVSPT